MRKLDPPSADDTSADDASANDASADDTGADDAGADNTAGDDAGAAAAPPPPSEPGPSREVGTGLWGGVQAAFDAIVALVGDSREPAAVFVALFAVIVVAFLGIVGLAGDDAIGWATLAPVGLLFALVCWGVLIVERRRSRRRKPRHPVLRVVLFEVALALLLVASGGVAYAMGALQAAAPSVFPEHAARTALESWVESLDRFLQAETEDARVETYRDLAARFSPRYRRDKLPKGTARALADDDTAALAAVAARYRSWYGRCSAAQLEAAARESWNEGDDRATYFVTTISYRGEFLPNEIRDLRMTPLEIKNSVENPSSPRYQRLHAWIRGVFPNHDEREFWEQVREIPISDLLEENAADLLAYHLGDLLGEPAEKAYRFGTEVTVSSVRMVTDSEDGWVVDEVGRWMLKRVLTDQDPPVVPTRSTSVDAPYAAQVERYLCQSAALAMLYQTLRGEPYPGGQVQLFEDLGPEATGHAARVAWANRHLGIGEWRMCYAATLPEAVERIETMLAAGRPVVMSTRLTSAGHVILVTGLEQDPRGEWQVVAHDPFGRFDMGSLRYLENSQNPGTGRSVRYPLRALEIRNAVWQSPDSDEPRLSTWHPALEEWRPTWSSLTTSGHVLASRAGDWEFLEVESP